VFRGFTKYHRLNGTIVSHTSGDTAHRHNFSEPRVTFTTNIMHTHSDTPCDSDGSWLDRKMYYSRDNSEYRSRTVTQACVEL